MLIIADASSGANSFRSLSGSISGPIALPTIILVKELWISANKETWGTCWETGLGTWRGLDPAVRLSDHSLY